MPETAEYILLSAASPEELQRLVDERLSKRWQLYGRPFREGSRFCQPMILTAANEKGIRETSDDPGGSGARPRAQGPCADSLAR